MTQSNYKAIPVSEALRVAEAYEKSMVVITAWDPKAQLVHTTTYGKDATDKELAALLGEVFARAAGADLSRARVFEDYRFVDEGKQAEKVEALHRACRAALEVVDGLWYGRAVPDKQLNDVRILLAESMK
jgi:hypothetical protein